MKHFTQEVAMPSANLTINKSRLPIYNKGAKMPTYYLTKGQEFQIELFNPTADIILAKIKLNNKSISQGGLVLKPGERVFLERYLDVAKKFLFDTYEVSGGSEAQKAIEQNGDFFVEFYKERQYSGNVTLNGGNGSWNTGGNTFGGPNIGTFTSQNVGGTFNINDTNHSDRVDLTTLGMMDLGSVTTSAALFDNTLNMDQDFFIPIREEVPTEKPRSFNKSFPNLKSKRVKKSKSIETGRVEKGSTSNQTIKTVDYDFDFLPFHTLEYKLLPQSQKVNTSNDIKIRKYCVDCGKKANKEHKFCSQCGYKI